MLCSQNMLRIVLVLFRWKTSSYSMPGDVILCMSVPYREQRWHRSWGFSAWWTYCTSVTSREDWDLLVLFLWLAAYVWCLRLICFLRGLWLPDRWRSWLRQIGSRYLFVPPLLWWCWCRVYVYAEIWWKWLHFSRRSSFSELSYIQGFLCYPVYHDVEEKTRHTADLLGSYLYWKPIWCPSTFSNMAGASIQQECHNAYEYFRACLFLHYWRPSWNRWNQSKRMLATQHFNPRYFSG